MADRQGYRLAKSRARDPKSLTFGGYMLFDIETGDAVFGGEGNARRGFDATLEDIEGYLSRIRPPKRRTIR